ncbi:MAG: class I SAM-dependent methyltransferase [Patescibacteria group bacterium]|nr:class I SAM-dependent methyltransferase [Patescibacteria group bacterium]
MLKTTGGNVLLDAGFVLSKAKIGENLKVADLGCGASGHFVFPSAKLVGKRGVVYAVDILKTVLEEIKRRARQENIDNIQTIWSNLEIFKATKIESGSLDAAFLINTLYQSHKRVEILREAVRMLKKGAKLLVVEWQNVSSPFGPPPEERVKIDLLKAGAKKLGLEIEEEFEAGQHHYGILFVKL